MATKSLGDDHAEGIEKSATEEGIEKSAAIGRK